MTHEPVRNTQNLTFNCLQTSSCLAPGLADNVDRDVLEPAAAPGITVGVLLSSGCRPCSQPGPSQQSLLTWPSCPEAHLRSHSRTPYRISIMRPCCQPC